MSRSLLFILFIFIVLSGYGQVQDSTTSIISPDTTVSVKTIVAPKTPPPTLDFSKILYLQNMQQWKATPEKMYIAEKTAQSKDALFYFLVGLVFYFTLVKLMFPRYVDNMFSLFFQANFRRNQTRDQLQQDVLPALLLNIFYIIVISAIIAEIVVAKGGTNLSFWVFGLYCFLVMTGIYFIKYLFIRLAGVMSGLSPVANMYLFIIFLLNKLMSVILLPVLFLLSFCSKTKIDFFIFAMLFIIVFWFILRYILAYRTIHKNLKVTPLQFFVYLCIIEFLPFLVFYEILSNKIEYNFSN